MSKLYAITVLFLSIFAVTSAQAGILTANYQGPVAFPTNDPARVAAQVYLPNNLAAKPAWPLILLLHGYEENETFINGYFGLDKEVTSSGFILVVPEGYTDTSGNHYWNASDACCDFNHTGVDDVGYLTTLIDQVSAKYHVDKTRIYATGHSNGAFMAHRLACDRADYFAAIAAFAGMTSLNPDQCKPSGPVSLLQIDALDDDTIKYAGDKGYPGLQPYPGAVASVDRWLTLDQCNTTAIPGPDLKITDSIPFPTDTTSQSWSGCQSNTSVQQWTIRAWSLWKFPHSPLLSWNFTDGVLKFLLSQQKVSPPTAAAASSSVQP